jgi:hypothetical protein
MADVRSKTGAATLSDFSGSTGTPIVVNQTNGDLAVLKTGDAIQIISPAGSSTQVFSAAAAAAGDNVVRADQNKNDLTSVSATIATGKLTLGLQPCIIQFRNSDVTNGAANTKFVSTALSLVTTDNGASFGLTTAIQGRLILIAIDNGTSTPVLGVINQSGFIDLSETGVLTSTTAIAGAVTSATTVYTTAALGAGLYPYKAVGAVDITWTSGSGYVTTPALVTGVGGRAIDGETTGTYTPTVTAQTGTFTTTSATSTWIKRGRLVNLHAVVTLTNVGTGATSLIITVPFNARQSGFTGSGYESGVTGDNLYCFFNSVSALYTRRYDNTFVPTNGWIVNIDISYFI